MKFIRTTSSGDGRRQLTVFLKSLGERASFSCRRGSVETAVRKIINDVRKKGNRAVISYTEKFDSVKLKTLAISRKEIESSARTAGREFFKILRLSARRIKAFHEFQKEKSWYLPGKKRILLGQIIRPIDRVGVYVPGGKASYPSTVLMNVIPARVAGVKEIALCVPSAGRVNPHVAAAIKMLGIREVYRIGGAQAIAAMAYGTETIRKVDKIVGPGNIYVATAKRMVFGDVGIDMFAGPSEILIIADRTANPSFIASDLLSQAEHDEMASSILVTDSETLAAQVRHELVKRLAAMKKQVIARKSLDTYGAIIVTETIDEAADIANRVAPEHLEIMTRLPAALLRRIRHAGAVFMGEWTPETLGDYVAGPNHTLPTCGTARFSSPLGVYDFIKRSSILKFNKEGFRGLARSVEDFADIEGLEAHGNSIRVRRG